MSTRTCAGGGIGRAAPAEQHPDERSRQRHQTDGAGLVDRWQHGLAGVASDHQPMAACALQPEGEAAADLTTLGPHDVEGSAGRERVRGDRPADDDAGDGDDRWRR